MGGTATAASLVYHSYVFFDPLDRFNLDHLQSVEAESGWYYNNRFLGEGGNGTAFLLTANSGSYLMRNV